MNYIIFFYLQKNLYSIVNTYTFKHILLFITTPGILVLKMEMSSIASITIIGGMIRFNPKVNWAAEHCIL